MSLPEGLWDNPDVTESLLPFGTPTSAVLYRTPERWRWAIYSDGVHDGALLTTPADCSVERAKADFLDMLAEVQGVEYEAKWHPSNTEPPGNSSDWWEAEIVPAGEVT